MNLHSGSSSVIFVTYFCSFYKLNCVQVENFVVYQYKISTTDTIYDYSS